jgi:hypothetical protein
VRVVSALPVWRLVALMQPPPFPPKRCSLAHRVNLLPAEWVDAAIEAAFLAQSAERVDRYEPTPDEQRSWLDEPWGPVPAERWELPRWATAEVA